MFEFFFTPDGISVLKGDEVMSCGSTPCPGVIVAHAARGAPSGAPSIRSMDTDANRKARTTAQVYMFLLQSMLKTECLLWIFSV